MINPMQLIGLLRGGGNPMQILTSVSQNNPQLAQVLNMVNGKTPAQMQEMAYQMAQQRGIDIQQLAQQMGITLPGRK